MARRGSVEAHCNQLGCGGEMELALCSKKGPRLGAATQSGALQACILLRGRTTRVMSGLAGWTTRPPCTPNNDVSAVRLDHRCSGLWGPCGTWG